MPNARARARVAIIDNSIFPDIYKPVEHWTQFLPPGTAWEAFTAREGCFPRLASFTHIILTGSEASILEPAAWVFAEVDVVRGAVDSGLAVLGSCWGHQLLAFALMGPGHVGRCPRPEIGWIEVRIDREDELFGGETKNFYTFSSHFDEVRNPEGMFEVLASTEACPVQAMRLANRPVWGIQSHPEVDKPTGRAFLADLVAAGFKGRDELRAAPKTPARDSGMIRTILSAFLASASRSGA